MGSDSSHCPSLSSVAWRHLGSADCWHRSSWIAAMDSATAASVYGMRFPVTARSRDDPRLLGWRMVDGKSQALQQRHLAELEAEGRKMKDQPKEDTPGSGMLAAIAHFDALQAAKKPAVIKAEAGREWIWERSCWDQSWLGLKVA